jgi:leucyl/phenylalanyl-tRNA--protein transferase
MTLWHARRVSGNDQAALSTEPEIQKGDGEPEPSRGGGDHPAPEPSGSAPGLRGFVARKVAKTVAPLRAKVDAGIAKYKRVRVAWPSAPIKAMARLYGYLPLDPELLLLAYSQGIFPMGVEGGKLRWLAPDPRGVVVLSEVHIPSRVRRYARNGGFEVRYDTDFRGTIAGCADRSETWISPELIAIYVKLHEMGAAHSVEAWKDGALVGGGFGVAMGRVFTLESLFSKVDQASKVAFVFLSDLLPKMGFELVDCQYTTRHFSHFGARDMRLAEYRQRMARGLIAPGRFAPAEHAAPPAPTPPAKSKPARPPRDLDPSVAVQPSSTLPDGPRPSRKT